jgi:hypothetical protein
VERRVIGTRSGGGVPLGWRRIGTYHDPGTACPASRRRAWLRWQRVAVLDSELGQSARARCCATGGAVIRLGVDVGVGRLIGAFESSVDAAPRTALDWRSLTTRSQRRSTPYGHGRMRHHQSAHSSVRIERSTGLEDIGRHVATLHSRAWSSLGSRGRGFESRRLDREQALTSGNTGQGFDFCL